MNIAMGCMGLSGPYGKTNDDESIRVIHAALERGVNLLDTGDFYASGHNELLVGKAIAGRRDQVRLPVKFGVMPGADRSWGGIDARPAALKNFLAYSLVRLGTDHVDLYQAHRYDHETPLEETMQAFADVVRSGKALYIGVSEWTADQIRADAVIDDLQDLPALVRSWAEG